MNNLSMMPLPNRLQYLTVYTYSSKNFLIRLGSLDLDNVRGLQIWTVQQHWSRPQPVIVVGSH